MSSRDSDAPESNRSSDIHNYLPNIETRARYADPVYSKHIYREAVRRAQEDDALQRANEERRARRNGALAELDAAADAADAARAAGTEKAEKPRAKSRRRVWVLPLAALAIVGPLLVLALLEIRDRRGRGVAPSVTPTATATATAMPTATATAMPTVTATAMPTATATAIPSATVTAMPSAKRAPASHAPTPSASEEPPPPPPPPPKPTIID